MSCRSTLGTAVAALLALGTPITKADDPAVLAEPVRAEPVHVAKGEGYVICAMPHVASGSPFAKLPKPRMIGFRFPLDEASRSPGASVLHISLGNGAVKCLLATGETSYPSVPMGINRIYYFQSRVLGICADRQRLYVLIFVGGAELLDFGDRGTVPRKRGQSTPLSGIYYLSVFDVRKGTRICDLDLKDAEIPTLAPLETLDKGPLELLDDGVAVYGKTFRFDGGKLTAESSLPAEFTESSQGQGANGLLY
ncbi:MAG TPA: hypothetical protein VMY42_21815 [Thermoguttaceae bacterium]|nr:hypothetical protein [Thermoguttaceae bacterium]